MEDSEAVEVAQSLSHPIRIGFLRMLRRLGEAGDLSPVEFAEASDAYHVQALLEAAVIEMAGTVARRGAREHRYSLTGPRAEITLAVLDLLEER